MPEKSSIVRSGWLVFSHQRRALVDLPQLLCYFTSNAYPKTRLIIFAIARNGSRGHRRRRTTSGLFGISRSVHYVCLGLINHHPKIKNPEPSVVELMKGSVTSTLTAVRKYRGCNRRQVALNHVHHSIAALYAILGRAQGRCRPAISSHIRGIRRVDEPAIRTSSPMEVHPSSPSEGSSLLQATSLSSQHYESSEVSGTSLFLFFFLTISIHC